MSAKVEIFIGSISDKDKVEKCLNVLNEFGVEYNFYVASAHRTPEFVKEKTQSAKDRGVKVIIAGAGAAAHLAGAIAGQTVLPVIGIPINATCLNGLDSLLATVQMPSGIPVATVAVDGAANAAFLAIQILATNDEQLSQKLADQRKAQQEKILAVNS